jgi:hypothetical protein
MICNIVNVLLLRHVYHVWDGGSNYKCWILYHTMLTYSILWLCVTWCALYQLCSPAKKKIYHLLERSTTHSRKWGFRKYKFRFEWDASNNAYNCSLNSVAILQRIFYWLPTDVYPLHWVVATPKNAAHYYPLVKALATPNWTFRYR